MSWEYILGIIGVFMAAVMTAFGIGRSGGKSKAESEARERETQIKIEAEQAASKRQVETAKEASDVQNTVARMSDGDVDDELRKDWLNKS